MNDLPNDEVVKTTFSPVPGLTVQYMKIAALAPTIIRIGSYHNSRPMVNQIFKKNSLEQPFLSDEELARVNTFKALKRQVEWMCGRFALKSLIRQVLDPKAPLEEIRIDYREKGAPYAVSHPRAAISLSHSGDYAAAALSTVPGQAIGIDVEKIEKKPDDAFMKTAFSRHERAHMPATAQGIYTNWTLKEAFLKYIGLGFNESLHKVEVIHKKIFHHADRQRVFTDTRIIGGHYALSLVWGKSLMDNFMASC